VRVDKGFSIKGLCEEDHVLKTKGLCDAMVLSENYRENGVSMTRT